MKITLSKLLQDLLKTGKPVPSALEVELSRNIYNDLTQSPSDRLLSSLLSPPEDLGKITIDLGERTVSAENESITPREAVEAILLVIGSMKKCDCRICLKFTNVLNQNVNVEALKKEAYPERPAGELN